MLAPHDWLAISSAAITTLFAVMSRVDARSAAKRTELMDLRARVEQLEKDKAECEAERRRLMRENTSFLAEILELRKGLRA